MTIGQIITGCKKIYIRRSKMRDLIAFCGLDCEKCDARIATMNNDDSLRRKTAELWSRLNGAEITADMINCEGCRVGVLKTPFCGSLCQIRQCALKREVETCGSCPEMNSCVKLEAIISNNEEALRNLKNG